MFTETELPGAYIIDLETIGDERGFFARAWDAKESAERGLETRVAQANCAFNARKGTLRGMHLQRPPHEEGKFVRCTRGAFFDAIVDLRPGSETFKRWTGVELTAENRRMFYVPPGFAHGYETLEDDTEALYLVTEFYAPGAETGVRWDDPAFGIEWPIEPTLISDKDRSWPDFEG